MKLNEDLLRLLSKTYEKSTLVKTAYKGKDICYKTDDEGNPVLLFIGKEGPDGNIKGERYARTLKLARDGKLLKDHWELKGKAT